MNYAYVVHTMIPKVQEKAKAIEFRQKGMSYKDILRLLAVSKSSLSLWLKDLPLTDEEKSLLKTRKNANISRGRIKSATANRRNRLLREKEQFEKARLEFALLSTDPFFLSGVALYWAEGSKRSSTFQFMNSDPDMIQYMLLWCKKYLNIETARISLRLYTHKPFAGERFEEYWSEITNLPLTHFKKTIYKPSNLGVKKRPQYKGCVRVEISRGMYLLRKMQFWQNLLLSHFKEK